MESLSVREEELRTGLGAAGRGHEAWHGGRERGFGVRGVNKKSRREKGMSRTVVMTNRLGPCQKVQKFSQIFLVVARQRLCFFGDCGLLGPSGPGIYLGHMLLL